MTRHAVNSSAVPAIAASHPIRSVSLVDGPVLCGLYAQLGYPAPEADFVRRLALVLADPTQTLLVIGDLGAPVACIHLNRLNLLEADGYAQILALIVDDAHRSAGLGTALVAAAETWALAQGCTKLTVRSNVLRVRTHGFYERLGFPRVKSQHTFTKSLTAG